MVQQLSGPNPTLARAIQTVLQQQTPTSVSIQLKLYSPSAPALNWQAVFINHLTIVQDFTVNYGDEITCEIRLAPKDAVMLHAHLDDLMASLKFTYLGLTAVQKMLNIAPVVKQYRVLVKNAQDLRRAVQGAKGRVEPTMTLQLQLIDPVLYTVRQRVFYSTFSQTTMEGVLRHIASAFGVTRLALTPPDNVHVYDHLIIPPALKFAEIWSYLQNTYGIYFKGICAYVTDRTLYLYPPYEHERQMGDMVHFYLDDRGAHAGLTSYHRVQDDVVEVVLDGDVRSTDLSQQGGENTGTGVMFSRSDQILDGYMQTTATGSAFTHRSSMMVHAQAAKTIGGQRFHIQHAPQTTDNVFALTANLLAQQAELVEGEWRAAVPNLLKPGHPLKYLYDDEGTLATSKGILDAVAYDFTRVGPMGENEFAFTGLAMVRLRVAPEHT